MQSTKAIDKVFENLLRGTGSNDTNPLSSIQIPSKKNNRIAYNNQAKEFLQYASEYRVFIKSEF